MRFAVGIIACASLALASPIVNSSERKRAMLSDMDYQIINLARNLESLELALWNQGLNNYTDANFTSAGYPGFRTYLKLFRDQEIAHFTLINNALGGGFANCSYTFPATTPAQFLTFSQIVTSVGEGALIGALANVTDPGFRQVFGEIIGNEARQNSKLRETTGLDYFNAVNFDTPLTASQAYSLAKPYLTGCPSTNAPIKAFKSIPPINATFTTPGPHKGGDSVMITWDASAFYLGPDVHINFLGDMSSLASPFTQSKAGVGMTTLPAGINGTAFLVATNFQGGGPIPDAQNFGIGALVVA